MQFHFFRRPFLGVATLLLVLTAAADQGSTTVPVTTLKNLQESLGFTNYWWDGDSLLLSNKTDWVRFYAGRKKTDVNGIVVWLNAPVQGLPTDGTWRIAVADVNLLSLALLAKYKSKRKPLRVMLDAGHGGDDEGASSKDPPLQEKSLTLALAQRIGAGLIRAGLKVEYTRTQDTTLTLLERTELARRKKADLFVSIHANHASNNNATGVETYVLPPSGFGGTAAGTRARGWQIGNRHDYHNTMLGYAIHSQLVAVTNNLDRGLKRQAFFVLRENTCPAVLLEFGFLSNPAETKRMCRRDWQEQSCAAVVSGVVAYATQVVALDGAVQAKHKRDAAANERWRKYLAQKQKAESSATNNATQVAATARAVTKPTDPDHIESTE